MSTDEIKYLQDECIRLRAENDKLRSGIIRLIDREINPPIKLQEVNEVYEDAYQMIKAKERKLLALVRDYMIDEDKILCATHNEFHIMSVEEFEKCGIEIDKKNRRFLV